MLRQVFEGVTLNRLPQNSLGHGFGVNILTRHNAVGILQNESVELDVLTHNHRVGPVDVPT